MTIGTRKFSRVEWIGIGISVLLLITLVLFLDILALMKTWEWFIAPFGLPLLTAWHAIGVYLFATLFVGSMRSSLNDLEQNKNYAGKLFQAVFRPTLILMIGWFVQQYVTIGA